MLEVCGLLNMIWTWKDMIMNVFPPPPVCKSLTPVKQQFQFKTTLHYVIWLGTALHSILAWNTYNIDLNLIGAKTHVQDRIVGAHFFQSCTCDATP